MSGPFLDDEDPKDNPLKDFGAAGGGIPKAKRRQPAAATYYSQGETNPMLDFAMDTHRQGLANHAAAAGAINSAISKEMESRVAQEREARRMEHEKYLANMRVQMAKKEQEGQIIRSLLNG